MNNFEPEANNGWGNEPEFAQALATALISADTLFTGDVSKVSGRDRFIVDQWTSNAPLPAIHGDPAAVALRERGGMFAPPDEAARTAVAELVGKYDLHDLPDRVVEMASGFEDQRRGVVERLMHSMKLMIKTAVAIADGGKVPSYEERYMATTGQGLTVYDPKDDVEKLRAALAKRGFDITTSRDLADTTRAWRESLGFVPNEDLAREVLRAKKYLTELVRDVLFSKVDFGDEKFGRHLEGVSFDGYEFRPVTDLPAHATATNTFIGGEDADGNPLFRALFEYNIRHPMTMLDLIHITAHEGVPGHYANAVAIDVLRRSGRLGFEASVETMCTGEVAFQEGWAQVWPELLHGSREAMIAGCPTDELGNDWDVQFTTEDLQDGAKNNAGIYHQVDMLSIDAMMKRFREQFGLPDYFCDKMTRWGKNVILGPMYGPSYMIGGRVLRQAISRNGVARVAQVGLHTEGLMDLQAFREKIGCDPVV